MINKRGSKRPVESILVTKGDAALLAGGTNIVNASGNFAVADGQLAIVDDSGEGTNTRSEAIAAGDTVAESPAIKIYQGNGINSNDVDYPITARPVETSETIVGEGILAYTGKAYEAPLRSTTVLSAISALDETTYRFETALRGRRVDEYHSSVHGIPFKVFEYVSPDYSTAGLANDVDHLISNLAWTVSRNSRQFGNVSPNFGGGWPVVALGVDESGGAGTIISSAVGTVVDVFVTPEGQTLSITIDQELFDTFAELVSNGTLPATTTIETIDFSAGAATPPGSGTIDSLVLYALNEREAYEDRNKFIKIQLEVGLTEGFGATVKETLAGDEGSGTYKQWKIFYDDTAGQRKYHQYRGYEMLKIEYPDSLVSGETYNAYIIESMVSNKLELSGISALPKKTIILVPVADTATKASLEAVLNPWMNSVNRPSVTL